MMRGLLLLLLAVGGMGTVSAEPARKLTLTVFLSQVTRENLDLEAARLQVPLAKAAIEVAKVFPDPLISGDVRRLVVLYRAPGAPTWMRKELVYNAAADRWIGVVNASGTIEYFAQAVDAAGNVATALDYGNPFRATAARVTYLPVVAR